MLRIIAWILIAVTACAAQNNGGVIPVAVVAWPSPIKAQCLVEMPRPPEPLIGYPAQSWETRVYVSKSDLDELVRWQKDITHWASTVVLCIEKLTERPR